MINLVLAIALSSLNTIRYINNNIDNDILLETKDYLKWLLISLFSSINEELVFRHFIKTFIDNKIFSSLIFSLIHGFNYFIIGDKKTVIIQIGLTYFLGMYLYDLSLTNSILVHFIYNFSFLTIMFYVGNFLVNKYHKVLKKNYYMSTRRRSYPYILQDLRNEYREIENDDNYISHIQSLKFY